MGIHTRIDDTMEHIIDAVPVGNIYINRNMIGAVVGVQPFGGHGRPAPARRPPARIIWRGLPPNRR